MSEKIKVAIIGCGAIANSAHIPAYMKNEKVEIKYFCDIIPERADAAVEKYGCGKAVYDYHEILDDPELDSVSVCTHNDLHSVIAIDFMRAGKDVLSEKPAARVLSEALEMQRVSHETDRILSIGVCNRFGNAVNHIKDLIDAGEPKPLTASGEAFCKLGKNIKDYVYTNMWAENTADKDGVFDVDDSVTGIVRTDGPTITFNGAWAENIGEDETYIDFIGDKAGIRLEYGEGFVIYSVKNGMLMRSEPKFRTNNFYEAEINSFVDCVINHEHNRADIDFAIGTSKIMQAIYDSSELHREVVID